MNIASVFGWFARESLRAAEHTVNAGAKMHRLWSAPLRVDR